MLLNIYHGGIAQLGERLNAIQEVSGSIPLISTKNDKPQVQNVLWFFHTLGEISKIVLSLS